MMMAQSSPESKAITHTREHYIILPVGAPGNSSFGVAWLRNKSKLLFLFFYYIFAYSIFYLYFCSQVRLNRQLTNLLLILTI
jgi:hypothetical protein